MTDRIQPPVGYDEADRRAGEYLLTRGLPSMSLAGGSSEVPGFHVVTLADALASELGERLEIVETHDREKLVAADPVLLSIETFDRSPRGKSPRPISGAQFGRCELPSQEQRAA